MSKFSIIYLRDSVLPFKGDRLQVDKIERLVVADNLGEAVKLAPRQIFKNFHLFGVKQI